MGNDISYTKTIKDRFGYEPGDPEFAEMISKLMQNPDYGLKKKKPVEKVQKKEVEKIDPIQKAIEEEKRRRKKFSGGIKNWFK